MKTTPPRRRRQAQPPKQKIVQAVGSGAGRGTATGKGQAIHAAVGSGTAAGTASAKSSVILAGAHKLGFRKSWGMSEFAQDALQALYAETLPVYISSKVLGEVRKYLEHNTRYRATYGGDKKIGRMTVARALQRLCAIRR